MLCLLVGEITFAPDLPQPQCGKVFRRIPVLRLLLPGFFMQHPLHHPTVLGAAYALLPTGTVAAVFPCSQVSFLLSFLVVAGVCQYFSLWTDIDICFRIIGECFRLEAFRVGRRIVGLTGKKYRSVRDAIEDLEDVAPVFDLTEDEAGTPLEEKDGLCDLAQALRNSAVLKNHIVTRTTDTAMERFRALKQGENFHALDESLKTNTCTDASRTQNTIYLRLNYDEPRLL